MTNTHEIRFGYPDDLAERLKECAGQKWRPSNGSEGAMFMESWCDQCQRDAAYQSGKGDSCSIVAMTMSVDVDSPSYPLEWQYGPDGQPRCTAFELNREIQSCPTCRGSGTVNPLTAPADFLCVGTTGCPHCIGTGEI